jgi:hypothetical protein
VSEELGTMRAHVCDTAKALTTGDRNKDYGSPTQNFVETAALWSVYTGHDFTAHDVAVMMILVKVGRLMTSPTKVDNWIDIAGYSACGAEAARDTLGSTGKDPLA